LHWFSNHRHTVLRKNLTSPTVRFLPRYNVFNLLERVRSKGSTVFKMTCVFSFQTIFATLPVLLAGVPNVKGLQNFVTTVILFALFALSA